ncbi:hypothetical protein LK518_16035 [Parabacteroides distasonis]|uniref:hypothetical protein n=1 Tax=Parabacteroides distasonis TaxID=823 RepID=UPI001D0FD40D|nr:hypothetical protein [Parabacteroides distasonis]MCC2780917.1 hypothetical protein [Parabacteroides distasonis]MCQ5182183.1 hypothetical protein [Parabacteroides distasonis]
MSKEQLLSYLNEGRKRVFTLEDISGDEIKVSLLKRIQSRASAPRPIISPLYLETMQYAYYNGLVSEASFCERLKIPQNKIDKYL